MDGIPNSLIRTGDCLDSFEIVGIVVDSGNRSDLKNYFDSIVVGCVVVVDHENY